MIRDYRSVREVASAIARAADETMSAYRTARVSYEPSITDRLMSAIESSVNALPAPAIGVTIESLDGDGQKLTTLRASTPSAEKVGKPERKPLIWHAATLKSGSGSGAEEKEFGADILGVLSVDLPDYKVTKGFLAQAKRAEPGKNFSKDEWERLRGQCDDMLAITPDAFIMAYSKKRGVRFFSAEAVAAFDGRDLFDLYDTSVRTFFEKHLESFIGDRRLNKPHLDVVRAIYRHRDGEPTPEEHVLHLTANEAE